MKLLRWLFLVGLVLALIVVLPVPSSILSTVDGRDTFCECQTSFLFQHFQCPGWGFG